MKRILRRKRHGALVIALALTAAWPFSSPATSVAISDCQPNLTDVFDVQDFDDLAEFDAAPPRSKFVVPNELFPNVLRPHLTHAPAGLLAGVGSERILYDYLMTLPGRISNVVAVDYDPNIILFHRMNRALLRVTPRGDLEAYRELRTSARSGLIRDQVKRAEAEGRLIAEDGAVLLNRENRIWWSENVVLNHRWDRINEGPAPDGEFDGVNYLFERSQFVRLQNLALAGRYVIYQLDLRSAAAVAEFARYVRSSKQILSIFDISNAWEHQAPSFYLGIDRTAAVLAMLDSVADRDSVFVATHPVYNTTQARRYDTYYHAYTFGFLRDRGKTAIGTTNWPHSTTVLSEKFNGRRHAGPAGHDQAFFWDAPPR